MTLPRGSFFQLEHRKRGVSVFLNMMTEVKRMNKFANELIEELKKIMGEKYSMTISQDVKEDEVLSNHIYFYDLEQNEVKMCKGE